MEVGGTTRQVDFSKLGPTLTIAASLILAIRTARWPTTGATTTIEREWDVEVELAVRTASRVLAHLTKHKASLFPFKDVPFYVADDEDTPK